MTVKILLLLGISYPSITVDPSIGHTDRDRTMKRLAMHNHTKTHRVPSLHPTSQAEAREQARDQKVLLCVRRVLINAVGGRSALYGLLSLVVRCVAVPQNAWASAHLRRPMHILTV